MTARTLRLVLSDLHLGTGMRPGELNPFEDFRHDALFAELLDFYDNEAQGALLEVVFNGDIFDLLKVKIDGVWPLTITDDVATRKLQACLDGHPIFVQALKDLLRKPNRRLVYILGNHDLDMCFKGPQDLLRAYLNNHDLERLHFVVQTDAYHLPGGVQIRHGHQFEPIHRVDYRKLIEKKDDGSEVLALPWGSRWILEVMNPAKEKRSHVDRIQPLGRYLLGAFLFDTRFVLGFLWHSTTYFIRRRVFDVRAWGERMRRLPQRLREDILSLASFDDIARHELKRMRGVSHLIVGHSHGPRFMEVARGKLLVNTGTWMKMVNLDVNHLGQDSGLTYCTIEYRNGVPEVNLLRWQGSRKPYETIPYAD